MCTVHTYICMKDKQLSGTQTVKNGEKEGREWTIRKWKPGGKNKRNTEGYRWEGNRNGP